MPDPTKRSPPVRVAAPLETKWPCPVCVGAPMNKVYIEGQGAALTLDYCTRCGGLWFDRGEVGQLAKREPAVLHRYVADRGARIRPPCLGCFAPLDRDAETCPACGHRNVLDCPVCDEPMERRAHAGLVLDLCRRCHGVWFDNAELSAIWRANLAAAAASTRSRRTGKASKALAVGGDVLVEAMFWSPNLVIYGGMAAGEAVGAAGGVAVEVVGKAAEGVFSVVMEIIAGLFDGL